MENLEKLLTDNEIYLIHALNHYTPFCYVDLLSAYLQIKSMDKLLACIKFSCEYAVSLGVAVEEVKKLDDTVIHKDSLDTALAEHSIRVKDISEPLQNEMVVFITDILEEFGIEYEGDES